MIGQTVGSYRVQSKLGEGGMGVVYIAEHPLLRKQAVVKFLHAELSSNAEIVERFFNEARSATMIRHPGIVDVFDFGHHASGCAFILMEFLDGESVADRLRKGPLDAAVAILIGRQIAAALGAAHEQGIIHRDLKPDNVYLVLDREAAGGARIKVLDFGIAKLAGATAGAVKTRTGAVMGTPSYMAPEQCRSAADVDHRADIYALGCILFEMVCGRPPFRAQSLGQLIAAHMFEPPPAPTSITPSIPADLEAVILRALAKDASERPASMAELAAQLSACAASEPAAVWANVAKPAGRQPTKPAAVVTADPTSADAKLAPRSAAEEAALKGTTLVGPPADAELKKSTTLGGSTGQIGAAAAPVERPRHAGKQRRWWIGAVVGTVLAGASAITFWQRDTTSSSVVEPIVAGISAVEAGVPSAPPDVAPEPAPSTVTLVIESEPEGAAVLREHDGMHLGVTRFEREVAPVAGGTLVYVLKLKGFEDHRVQLAGDRDDVQKVVLKPLVQGKKPPRVTAPTTPKINPPPKDEPKVPTGPAGDGMLEPKL